MFISRKSVIAVMVINLIPIFKYKKCENHNFSVLYNF